MCLPNIPGCPFRVWPEACPLGLVTPRVKRPRQLEPSQMFGVTLPQARTLSWDPVPRLWLERILRWDFLLVL